MKTRIETDTAPAAIGTYSQAIRVNETVYLSGQIGLNPATQEMVGPDVRSQIHRVFENLTAVAQACGADLNAIVKLNVYLVNLDDFGAVNEIMAQYFSEPYPARAAIGVAALPKG
ncbi:MAG: Rid family detoxifying hydrolase, partial [Gammaproteobacteria bacterium]